MQRDEAAIIDILRSARLCISFIGDVCFAEFERDEKTKSAILYQLIILGEATRRLSEDFRVRHSTIVWRSISGLRNVIVHEYDNIRNQMVWKVVKENLPNLIDELVKIDPHY